MVQDQCLEFRSFSDLGLGELVSTSYGRSAMVNHELKVFLSHPMKTIKDCVQSSNKVLHGEVVTSTKGCIRLFREIRPTHKRGQSPRLVTCLLYV